MPEAVKVELSEYRRLLALDAAVRRAVTQQGDNLCWRDLYEELAGLVGVKFCPQLMASREQFIANCRRFDESLRAGLPYEPAFPEKGAM